MVNVLLFAAGLLLIIIGGDLFVEASVGIAEKLRIPKFVIGATIVSLATTLPELIVSVLATLGGKYEMAAGNAIGSIVANIGLILAITLVFSPQKGNRRITAALLIAAELVTLLFSLHGKLGYVAAGLLFATCIAFLTFNLRESRLNNSSVAPGGTLKHIAMFFLGVVGLIVGSRLLVSKGSALAASLGVPESVIAVTIVAIGTSLPEFVTSISALIKGQSSLSVGNILGANIMDVAFIMPICALISGGLTIRPQTLLLDLPFCLVLSTLAFFPKKKGRALGIALLSLYALYLALLFIFFV